MKKAILVAIDVHDLSGKKKDQAAETALAELNEHLAAGWEVVHSVPMSGTGHTIITASIVILEKA